MGNHRLASMQFLVDATGRAVGLKEADGDEVFFPTFNAAQTVLQKPDGTALSGTGEAYILPVATAAVLGGVKAGSGVTIAGDGTMSVAAGGSAYTLPAATAAVLGGVKVGANVSVAADGTISVAAPTAAYSLPVATSTVLGGVKAGAGVTIAGDGTLSASGGGTYDATAVETLSNKRIRARVVVINAPGATPTFNTDNCDRLSLTGMAASITSMTTGLTGTPVAGDTLAIEFTGASAYSIAWGTSYEPSTINMPLTTVGGQKLTVYFDWNSTASKWRCVGYA